MTARPLQKLRDSLASTVRTRCAKHRRVTRTRAAEPDPKPLLLALVFAAAASAMTGEWVNAVIVVAIVLAT
jgi:hypothetical protein